jgi:hypothetical protein
MARCQRLLGWSAQDRVEGRHHHEGFLDAWLCETRKEFGDQTGARSAESKGYRLRGTQLRESQDEVAEH